MCNCQDPTVQRLGAAHFESPSNTSVICLFLLLNATATAITTVRWWVHISQVEDALLVSLRNKAEHADVLGSADAGGGGGGGGDFDGFEDAGFSEGFEDGGGSGDNGGVNDATKAGEDGFGNEGDGFGGEGGEGFEDDGFGEGGGGFDEDGFDVDFNDEAGQENATVKATYAENSETTEEKTEEPPVAHSSTPATPSTPKDSAITTQVC